MRIWQRSRQLVSKIYQLTAEFPEEEKFTLTRQIRRSAISIPSNIAEGCGRGSNKQLIHFLDIAQGSCFELETQLILATDLLFIKNGIADQLALEIREIQKMIDGFKTTLKS